MLKCPQCELINPPDTLECRSCGKPLLAREPSRALPAFSQTAAGRVGVRYTPPGRLAPAGAGSYAYGGLERAALDLDLPRARRFLGFALALALMTVVAPVAHWVAAALEGGEEPIGLVNTLYLAGLVGFMGLVLLAFLAAKSCELMGESFIWCFLVALVPPLVPGLLARAAGRSMFVPYLWLVLDAVIIGGAIYSFDRWPWAVGLVLILMLPLVVYHLLGCALGSFSSALGLNSYMLFGWVCLAPLLLTWMMLMENGLALEPSLELIAGLALSTDHLAAGRELVEMLGELYYTRVVGIAWLLLGCALWIKAIYSGLKIPALD